jgi:hypothetical protein
MSDQPSDHDDMVADRPTDQKHGRDQPPTNQPTTPAWVSMEIAAADLNITVNAVRQRIKRGTLIGIKTEAGWLVDMVATNQESGTDRPTTRPTNHATTPTDQQPTIDLAPLVDHIAGLERQVQHLTEAATGWQIRARQAEDQLKQLTAGEIVPDTAQEAPGSPETNETGPRGVWDRLRRWIAREG